MDSCEADWNFAGPWGARGRVADLGGQVHWVEFAPSLPDGAHQVDPEPPIVFVHGLGGSHLNWSLVAPALTRQRRGYAIDLPGFGMTPGDGRDTSVEASAALLARFVEEVAGGPAILVANSMGGVVSVLMADERPDLVAAMVLLDPALPVAPGRPDLPVASQFLLYAVPFLGERYLRELRRRHTTRETVERVVRLCFADPARADPRIMEAGVRLAEARADLPGIDEGFLRAARSLMRTLRRTKEYRAMLRRITVPVLLIHGESDRLVSPSAARIAARENPRWETVFLPGVGHTPMLEVPDQVVAEIGAWFTRNRDAVPA